MEVYVSKLDMVFVSLTDLALKTIMFYFMKFHLYLSLQGFLPQWPFMLLASFSVEFQGLEKILFHAQRTGVMTQHSGKASVAYRTL